MNPHYLPLDDNAARQYIDAVTVFKAWRQACDQAAKFVGGMYFKREAGYEYLVKTSPDNRQQRLGPRNERTEQVHAAFTVGKQDTEEREHALRAAVQEAVRLNKALRVGRVPNKVIAVLQALDAAGLSEHFTVVGTHALYAYETAAAVRIMPAALATQDVDLLWDARRRVQFLAKMAHLDSSLLKVLQRAEPTFRRMEGQLETVMDDKGFQVDFLRREPVDEDPHPFRFTDDEDDVWPVQAPRAAVLTSAPRFEQVVVGANGRMALMTTIAPQAFVEFKQWMAELSRRPAIKRRRDALQAGIVSALMDEGALV